MRFHFVIVLVALATLAGCGSIQQSDRTDIRWPGTAQRRETDFDQRIWNGTSIELIGGLIERLPNRVDSAAEHRLARNILVAMADAPPDARDSSAFVTLRVAKLMSMGSFADAAALSRRVSDLPRDERSAAREAEAELLAGEVEMACIDLQALAQRSTSPWVEEGVALCRARTGERGTARSAGTDWGVLVRIEGRPLPTTPPNASIAELAAVALDPKLAPAQRLPAAFEAARANAIDGAAFAKILQAVPIEGHPRANPPATGAEAAALFHAVEHADPARKLVFAESALLSPAGNIDEVSVALALPLRTVKPSGELAPLAARLARLLFAVGDVASAGPWAELAARSGQGWALWPHRTVLGEAKPGEFDKWRKQTPVDGSDRVLAVASAFDRGRSVALLQAADRSPSAELAAMDEAANAQRVGETVLRALVLLGSEGPGRTNPEMLGRVLVDLDRVNLHDEARALAFEALAAARVGP